MANCSSADGTITVDALEGCSINSFWEALSTLTTKWDYGFTPNWSSDHEEATVSFSGIGRWSFQNNLDCLGLWLSTELEENPSETSLLERTGWTLEFDYDDFEAGMGFAAHERVIVTHEAGTQLTTCGTNLLEQEVFNHDPVSLVVNFDWSEDDALEECYGYYEGTSRYDIEDCIESLGWIETGIYQGDAEAKETMLAKLKAELEKAA